MTANITQRNGKDLMAANVTRGNPWHGLGERVESDMNVSQALTLVEANDRVTLEPVFAQDPYHGLFDTPDTGNYWTHSNLHGPIAVVGDRYEVMQRRQILELAYEIVGLDSEGTHIDTIGNLGPRANQFFAYIRQPNLVIDPNGVADVIERGLFVATSFDASMPNVIGYSPIRPVCSNTVHMALGKLTQAIKVRHRKGAVDRMKEAARALRYAAMVEAEMQDRATKMLQVPADRALSLVQDEFWPLGGEITDRTKAKREAERAKVEHLLWGEDNTAYDLVGNNGYAVFQAFTEYIDHFQQRKPDKHTSMQVARASTSVLPGRAWDQKVRASALILALAA